MSGTRSGLSYNTWPLIDGEFAADGLFSMSVWYLNFENPLTIHFDHRMLAYALCIILFTQIIHINKRFSGTPYKRSSLYLLAIMLYQVIRYSCSCLSSSNYNWSFASVWRGALIFGVLRHFYMINYCRFRLLRGPAQITDNIRYILGPTDNLTTSLEAPASSCCSSVSWLCVVDDGCIIRLLASPIFAK